MTPWGWTVIEEDGVREIHVWPANKDEEQQPGHVLKRSCGCCPEFYGLNNYGAAIIVHNMVN